MAHRGKIASGIQKMNDDNKIIDSVAMLSKTLQEKYGIEAKEKEIKSVLRDDLNMRYKKIREVSIYSNSERNLVLRQ